MLSGVSHLTVLNVNNPVGLVCLPYVMWSAHFFVTHTQTEKISSWNGPTVHVCCFMLARASTKTFVSRIHIRQPSPKNREKIFISQKIRQQGHSLSEVSLYWIPGHAGVRRNEIADKLTKSSSGQQFIGPETILGVSRQQNIRRKMKRMQRQHLALWRGP